MVETTSIRVYDDDKDRLARHGYAGESYAEALSRVLDAVESPDREAQETTAEEPR